MTPGTRWLWLWLALAFLGVGAVRPVAAQSPEEQLAAASALFDAKKYSEASVRLEQFLAANPKHAKVGAAALALARCYAETRQFTRAIPAYEKSIASKDPTVQAPALLGLGEAALQASSYEKAATALDAAVKLPLRADQAPLAWLWLGQAQFQLGRFQASEDAYVRVTQSYPRSEFVDNAWFGAGLSAMRLGKPDAARTRLRTVIDRFKTSPDRSSAQLALGQVELEQKRYQEAKSVLEFLLAEIGTTPAKAEIRVQAEETLVAVLLELEQFDVAAKRLELVLARMLATEPSRPRVNLTLGHCRYRQKLFDPALAAYREAAKSTDDAVGFEGLFWAGNAALALDRGADAAVLFGQAVVRGPKHALAARAQLRQGDALMSARQPEAATAAYRKVVASYPQSPEAADARKALSASVDAFTDPAQLVTALKTTPPADRPRGQLRLARLYFDKKRYVDALMAVTDLLKLTPEPEIAGEGQYVAGLSLEAQGKPAAAITALLDAVRRAPKSGWVAEAQTRLAWLHLDQRQAAQAEKAAAAALTLSPAPDVERQARLAQLQAQLDQEKWDAALENCRLLAAGNPPPETLATILFAQAWAMEKQGKQAEALPLWERLNREHAQSDYAADALLHLGDDRFKAEKWDEAVDRYSQLVQRFPKSPLVGESRFKLGSSHYNAGRHAMAAAEWDRVAVDKSAGDYQPESLYWAGIAHEKAGKKPEAIDRLQRLVTQFPKHARVNAAKLRLAALKAVMG